MYRGGAYGWLAYGQGFLYDEPPAANAKGYAASSDALARGVSISDAAASASAGDAGAQAARSEDT